MSRKTRYRKAVTYDPGNGEKVRKYFSGSTPEEAERAAAEFIEKVKKGEAVNALDLPFAVWADKYLEGKEGDMQENEFAALKGRCKWWSDRFGRIPVPQIRYTAIQDGIRELAKYNVHTHKPSSRKTLKDYRAAVKGVLDIAVRDRVIPSNPAEYAKIPSKSPKTTRDSLTREECMRIEQLEHRAQLPAMIMLYAGLRVGEVLALTVGDIDLANKMIKVNKTVYYPADNNTPKLKRGGKTPASTREVTIVGPLVSFLRDKMKGRKNTEIVVCGYDGKHMTKTAFRRMWQSYLISMNYEYGVPESRKNSKHNPQKVPFLIRRFTPHYLRHTYASILYDAGVDVLAAQKQLGHTDPKTTLGVYTHLSAAKEKQNMEKLEKYLVSR